MLGMGGGQRKAVDLNRELVRRQRVRVQVAPEILGNVARGGLV